MELANLTEGLAIYMGNLTASIAPKVAKNAIDLELGIVQRMAHAGATLRTIDGDLQTMAPIPSEVGPRSQWDKTNR